MDDEPDNVNLAKMMLESEGYQVITGANGNEAHEKVRADRPDLILLDVVMPGKSGFEVCRALKSDSMTNPIPIVMFTVLGREADITMGKEAGADGHLLKPFTSESLLDTVKTHLEKSRPIRFSGALGMQHDQLVGKKILFEFDPGTHYEIGVKDFVLEAQAHGDAVTVITRRTSILHQTFERQEGVEAVELTGQTLLSPILDAHSGEQLALVYDSITDLSLTGGFQMAYRFLESALEQLAKPEVTVLFLINPGAHAAREIASFRGLFSSHVAWGDQGLKKLL